VSADGRFVAFNSSASNLVAADRNGVGDVFVRDRLAGTIERVSVSSAGTEADRTSSQPAVSADGRYVAFSSNATNLVDGDTNRMPDVFVRDRLTGVTERVSVASDGHQTEWLGSAAPSISANGRFVAFESNASDLVPDDRNRRADSGTAGDVFVRDRITGTTERVSLSDASGAEARGVSSGPSISRDGRFVAFSSDASNLVQADTNAAFDAFVRDRATGATERVSVDGAGLQADGPSVAGPISADGDVVAFSSGARNLVGADDPRGLQSFVRERSARMTARLPIDASADEDVLPQGLSGDGRIAALVRRDHVALEDQDVYVYDRDSGRVSRGSGAAGGELAGMPMAAGVSADGRCVAFVASEPGLVPEDTNGVPDAFAIAVAREGRASVSPTSGPPTTRVHVRGWGLIASEAVGLRFDGEPVAIGEADAAGTVEIALAVPAGAVPGRHTLQIVGADGRIAAEGSFVVVTNWAQAGRTAAHTGWNPFENVLGPETAGALTAAWWSSAAEPIGAPAAVSGGVVYLASANDQVYAVSARTGRTRWSAPVPGLAAASPAVAAGAVVIASEHGALHALDAKTGATLWSRYFAAALRSSPTVANGQIYVHAGDGQAVSLDLPTSAQRWSANVGWGGTASPAMADGRVYLASVGTLQARSAGNGRLLWSTQIGAAGSPSSPAVYGRTVYGSDGAGTAWAVRAATGEVVWKQTLDGTGAAASVAVGDRVLYVQSVDGVTALRRWSGEVLWSRTDLLGGLRTAPALANGVLYVATSDSRLLALDAQTGSTVWSTPGHDGTSPVVADGTVFAGAHAFRTGGTGP